MKQILVASFVGDLYAGKVEGIKLEPIPDTSRWKLVGLVQTPAGKVTLAYFENYPSATQAFVECTKRVIDPSVDTVVLTFQPPEANKDTKVPGEPKIIPTVSGRKHISKQEEGGNGSV